MPAPAAVRSVLLADAPFLPTKIANLQLWLAADRLALADGAAVATWPDLSGNGTDATQSTAAARPTYTAGVVNSWPVVRFNATHALDTVLSTVAQPFTVFVAGKQTSKTQVGRFIDVTNGSTRALLYLETTGFAEYYAGALVTASIDRSGAFHVLEAVFNGASSVLVTDGAVESAGNPGATGIQNLRVGNGNFVDVVASASGLIGDVAEVVLYTRALTSAERSKVRLYLGSKYAIAVAS